MSTPSAVPNRKFDAIIFDLDSTLFDHDHSATQAMSAVTKEFPVLLQQQNLDSLVLEYKKARKQAIDQCLAQNIKRGRTELRIELFFQSLGLRPLKTAGLKRFRSIYRPAYAESRIATPGSLETLQRLHDSGFRLAILTNQRQLGQEEKASHIGVKQLVEHLISSQAVGCAKPDRRIFDHVTTLLGVDAYRTLMVGDNINTDIEGALGAGWSAVLYQPSSKSSSCRVKDQDVDVISDMKQLFNLAVESSTSDAAGAGA